jgi:tetratricopeptide (TPR) repeat protein
MRLYRSFLEPAIPPLVVGREKYVKRFETILTRFKAGDLKQNLINISGLVGIGKTSLLNLYSEILKREEIVFTQPAINIGNLNQNLFREIYRVLSPHLKEEKKGRLQKSKEVQIRSVTSKSASSRVSTDFIHNLRIRKPKGPIVIILDSIDRILDSEQKFILNILKDLINTLCGKYSLLFIIIIQEHHALELENLIQMGEHIVVEHLSLEDSKKLLISRNNGHIRLSNQFYEDFVKQSELSPFNLVFISEVIAWANEKIKNDSLLENEITIKELTQPFIRNFSLRAFIQEAFNLSEEEDKAIQFMLSFQRKTIHKESLPPDISGQSLKKLVKKGLIVRQENYFQFSSYALHSYLGLGTRVFDRKLEIEILFKVLEKDVIAGVEINPNVLERLEQIVYSSDIGENLPMLSQIKTLYDHIIDQNRYFEGYQFALIAGILYRVSNALESGGDFFEECAQSFYFRKKITYALKFYRKALEAFQSVNNKKKLKNVAERAAKVYLEQAEEYLSQNLLEFARMAFYHSIQLFKIAENFSMARKIANKAIQTYEESSHAKFFQNLVATN